MLFVITTTPQEEKKTNLWWRNTQHHATDADVVQKTKWIDNVDFLIFSFLAFEILNSRAHKFFFYKNPLSLYEYWGKIKNIILLIKTFIIMTILNFKFQGFFL